MFVISRSSGALVPVSITAARDFCRAKGVTTAASTRKRGLESAIAITRTIVTTWWMREILRCVLIRTFTVPCTIRRVTRVTRPRRIVGNFWTQVDVVGR